MSRISPTALDTADVVGAPAILMRGIVSVTHLCRHVYLVSSTLIAFVKEAWIMVGINGMEIV